MAQRIKLVSASDFINSGVSHTDKITFNPDQNFVESKLDYASHLLNDSSIPSDIKLQLYSSALNSMNDKLEEILNKPVKADIVSDAPKIKQKLGHSNVIKKVQSSIILDSTDLTFIQSLPPTCRNNASLVISILKPHPKLIKWDEKGEVTFFDSETVDGSNITDLINYAIRNLKWTKDPPGINRFLAVCKMLNVPTAILSNSVKNDWFGTIDNIRPRRNVTDSILRAPSYRQLLKNWEAMDEEDLIDDEEDQFNQSSYVTPTASPTSTPSSAKKPKNITFRTRKPHKPK